MTTGKTKAHDGRAARATKKAPASDPPVQRATRTDTLISLMRADGGASAEALAKAVGWQVHSVRGFISGTLKKRGDLEVLTSRSDGKTRYAVRDRAGTAA